jgi:hypothetical protein
VDVETTTNALSFEPSPGHDELERNGVRPTARDCLELNAEADFAMITVAFLKRHERVTREKVDEAAEHHKDFADESCSTELAGPNAKLNVKKLSRRAFHATLPLLVAGAGTHGDDSRGHGSRLVQQKV